MNPKFQQLLLNLPMESVLTIRTFIENQANWEALTWIKRWPNWPVRSVVIYGEEGCGKTHLAHIWKNKSNAFLVTPNDVESFSVPDVLCEGNCFVVDGYDQIQNEKWLFHFYNLIQEKKGYLMLCGKIPPSQHAFRLPDLRSRLCAAMSIQVLMPDEMLLKRLMTKLFQERGLETTEEINDYLIQRIERSYSGVHQTVQDLDTYAYITKRSLTLNLVRRALTGNRP